MKIVAYASRPHYADHLRPIVDALPSDVCDGVIYGPRAVNAWGPQVDRYRSEESVWLLASYVDAQYVNAPFVYVEHGAGQSYGGDPEAASNPSYAGGEGRAWKECVLVIAPGNVAGARHMAARSCPVALVGCPYLDPWHRGDRELRRKFKTHSGRRVVFSFHWEGGEVCPEARSALPHYETGLDAAVNGLIGRGWEVWGHGHPRAQTALEAVWHGIDVPWVSREQIFDGAEVLVADNTSLLWEFASLGKPLVMLNAPWYRLGVDHGLRFWRWCGAGEQVFDAAEIPGAVDIAYHGDAIRRSARLRATREVYAHTDGLATQRAVTAIMETVCG